MRESLKAKAYREIKERIINCTYHPGMFSNEEFLQKELNLSRTPIRDALSRLEQEGFVTIVPKKGMKVTDITVAVINQLFEARIIVEDYGIKANSSLMDKAVLTQMKDRFLSEWDPTNIDNYYKSNELDKLYDIDMEFHRYIANPTGNVYIEKMLNYIINHDKRVRYYTGMIVNPQFYLSKHEPTNIIDALLSNRIDKAIMHLHLHLATAKNASLIAWINKDFKE